MLECAYQTLCQENPPHGQTAEFMQSSTLTVAVHGQAFDTILSSVNRSAWTPLYAQLKDLVCCSLSNDVRSIWISWTAASAAAGVRRPR